MNQSGRCQSCGMPLGEGFFGAEADGSASTEYCRFCYADGTFTDPNLTLAQMIVRSIEHMETELNIPPDRARELALSVLPNLKRWRTET